MCKLFLSNLCFTRIKGLYKLPYFERTDLSCNWALSVGLLGYCAWLSEGRMIERLPEIWVVDCSCQGNFWPNSSAISMCSCSAAVGRNERHCTWRSPPSKGGLPTLAWRDYRPKLDRTSSCTICIRIIRHWWHERGWQPLHRGGRAQDVSRV